MRESGGFGFCLCVFCLWMGQTLHDCLWTGQTQLRHLRHRSFWWWVHDNDQDFITFVLPWSSSRHAGCTPCSMPSSLVGERHGGRDPISPLMRLRLPARTPVTCNGHCWSQEQTNKQWPNAACLVSKENNLISTFSTKEIFSVYEAYNMKQRKWENIFSKNLLSAFVRNWWGRGRQEMARRSQFLSHSSCHYNWHHWHQDYSGLLLIVCTAEYWRWIGWAYLAGPIIFVVFVLLCLQ